MSSAYNYVRSKREEDDHSMEMFIREEVEHQERLEAAGYRSPTWRVLRALQSPHSATQLQGESAVAAPPFFPNAGRGTVLFWGTRRVESAIVALGLVLLSWFGTIRCSGRCSVRPDTRSEHSTASRPAQANGVAMWR